MKTNKKLLSLIVLSLLLVKPYNVFAAGADSFRTDEYKAMGENVLDLIDMIPIKDTYILSTN